jgi:hypothetical protein
MMLALEALSNLLLDGSFASPLRLVPLSFTSSAPARPDLTGDVSE